MAALSFNMQVTAYSVFILIVGIGFLPFSVIKAYPACLPLSIVIGLALIAFAVISVAAVFVLKSPKILKILFIFQLIVCFILLILAVSVVNTRQFEKDYKKAVEPPKPNPDEKPEKQKEAFESYLKGIDEMHNSLKCCTVNIPDLKDLPGDPLENTFWRNSCCDSSQLKPKKDEKDPTDLTNNDNRCPAKKAYEDCVHRFLDKQQGFRAAAVICLTLAIIFQLLLSFSFYNGQGNGDY